MKMKLSELIAELHRKAPPGTDPDVFIGIVGSDADAEIERVIFVHNDRDGELTISPNAKPVVYPKPLR